MSAVTSVWPAQREKCHVRFLHVSFEHALVSTYFVFIDMNLCTIEFNEQTIYRFIKLNKSISPTSKTATASVDATL